MLTFGGVRTEGSKWFRNKKTDVYNLETKKWESGGDYPIIVNRQAVVFYRRSYFGLGGFTADRKTTKIIAKESSGYHNLTETKPFQYKTDFIFIRVTFAL